MSISHILLLALSFVLATDHCLAFSFGHLRRHGSTLHSPVTQLQSSRNNDSTETTITKSLSAEQEEKLCLAAKTFINDQSGYYSSINTNILANDFIFRGPVIGPLNKSDYIEVLNYFKIYQAFPDIRPNPYGFVVDPSEPLKVRFFIKATGTYQNPIGGFLGGVAKFITSPDGREYIGSTEAWAISFSDIETMQVKSVTAGYVIDRFEGESSCTTSGKGLSFGILATIGLSLPVDAGSLSLLNFIQKFTSKFSDGPNSLFPKAYSDTEMIPEWWKDERRGAE